MADISTWSPTDESNTAAPPAGWPENMQPSAVNNSARAMMGAIRRWYDTVSAQLVTYLPLAGGRLTGLLTSSSSIIADGDITAGVNLHAGADIFLNGTGVHFVGSTTTGPYLQGANSGWAIRAGSGNGLLQFADSANAVHANINFATGDFTTTGNLLPNNIYLSGDSIHFAGATVAGPYLQATNTGWTARAGSGNGLFQFADAANAVKLTINLATGDLNATGNITAPAFIGNVTVPASGPISTGGTVTGGQVTSTGNINAAGTMSALGYQTKAGTAGALTGNYFNIEWRSPAHLWIDNVDLGWFILDAGSGISTSLLRGGNGNDSGVIHTAPTADPARHTLAFGWNSTDPTLDIVIDASFTGLVPWSQVIKAMEVQADAGAPTGWHLAVFTGGLINYFYSDVACDARLKQGIADTEVDALVALCAVPVRRFEWTPEVQKTFGVPQAPVEIGLVAQDMLHMPGIVGVSQNRSDPYPADTHTIMYDRLDAYYVRAIQQLAAENAALSARVTALENVHV